MVMNLAPARALTLLVTRGEFEQSVSQWRVLIDTARDLQAHSAADFYKRRVGNAVINQASLTPTAHDTCAMQQSKMA